VLLLPSSESGNTIVPSVVQYTKDGKVVVGEAAKVRLECSVQKHKCIHNQYL
jgi:molecular chaperone DnaK (HSP70)